MAKIENIHPAEENSPALTEVIEVRAWDLGGTDDQIFCIGSGFNFQASGNIWLEFIYSMNGAQIFYTRNFLHLNRLDTASRMQHLDQLIEDGEGIFGFGDILPETGLTFKAEKFQYERKNEAGIEETRTYTNCSLEFSADVGAVFGRSAPGERWIKIKLDDIEIEEGERFMRDLVLELDAVIQGKHPDPASLPAGSSEWPLVWQLNRKAYDTLSETYQEKYFIVPPLAEAFDGWMDRLPPGSQVLDAGCGHGEPVIARLLERGFQVTGADFSPEMLSKAQRKFPQVPFVQLATTQLTFEAVFDGACSFSSVLYLDPIDFYHAIYRLSRALKQGGLLFLYAYDNGPTWRGEPFSVVMKHWMWTWHYGMEEAAHRLEEHGHFQILDMQRVIFDAKAERQIEKKNEAEKRKEEKYNKQKAHHPDQFAIPYLRHRHERPPYAYVLIAQRKSR